MKHRQNRARNPAPLRKDINWELIASDLADAHHDLHRLLDNLGHSNLTPGRFKIALEHILFHLLCAWNIRFLTNKQWDALPDEEWDRYWTMPADLFPFGKSEERSPAKRRPGKFDRQWARRYMHRHWTRPRR